MRYKIGSFNMNRFGDSDSKDLDIIANIILGEDLDIVALQEIYSKGDGVKNLLRSKFPPNWKFEFAKPSEPDDLKKNTDMENTGTNGEGYAFLWNTRKFKLSEFSKNGTREVFKPKIVSNDEVYRDCTFFARTPFYARLQPVFGGYFELRLIDAHLYFGDTDSSSVKKRKDEFDFLVQEIYKDISRKRYGNFREAYTIAMGDYNLSIAKPYELNSQDLSSKPVVNSLFYDEENRVHVLTAQDQLTTLRKNELSEDQKRIGESTRYANNYDHFTYSKESFDINQPTCKPIQAIEDYCNDDFSYYQTYISDHLPIVMEVEID